jgi:hypothetical protein
MDDPRVRAWHAVQEALPGRWRVGPITYDPGLLRSDGRRGGYSVTARGSPPGRGKALPSVTATGDTEDSALTALDNRLRGVEQADGSQMGSLRRRLRLAYLEGAEAWMRTNLARALSQDETEAVIRRYPGP